MLQELVKHYKNKNELEALALSLDNPGAIFFTADTNSIIIDGKVFGIGSSRLFIGTQSDYDIAVLAGQIQNGAIVIIKPTYLTFTALEDNCSIGFYNNPNSSITPTIEYSFDKNNWDILTDDKITVPQNTNMYCRGINPGGISGGYGESGYNYFTGEGKFNVSGDIMTIIDYENMSETMVGTMMYMFGRYEDDYVDIVDASNLILNAITLTDDCYANMFDSCTSMVYGPQIKAKILAPFCCYKMFYNCALLTTVPVLSARTMKKECYAYMFYGCTALTIAPALPSTKLADSCYADMFSCCTALTTTPELPATTLVNRCYQYMFLGCTSLTTPPTLSATTLANSCYASMFSGCESLTTVPELPATTLADYCYSYMFYNCTSLTAAPELPATTLANYCYSNMFSGCTALTTPPALPATSLANSCYEYMFSGCTLLITAPALPATTLADYCYNYMFNNCTSLTTVTLLPATTLASNCYRSMFLSCASLTTTPELSATTLADYCCSYMFYNCTSLTTASALPATTLAYSCYSYMFCYCESLTTAPTLPATTLSDYCYEEMFDGCTSLTAAPTLPATTLNLYCYNSMFKGCTSLSTAPLLPATTLAYRCYSSMFLGCTSLTTAQEILPATTLVTYCYYYMFYGCTSLITAPELPATTLANYCYNYMFYNCANLNHITCLATDNSSLSCTSSWVYGVSSEGTFVKHPDMDDWSRDSSGIPSGWTVEDALIAYVTFTAEEDNSSIGLAKLSTNQTLEYSTDTITWNEFNTATNISLNNGDNVYVRGILSASFTPPNYTQFKMTGKIAASGNCNAIWNYEDLNAPLKAYCGYYMFYGCTALTSPPKLPATTLAECCYVHMFQNCTSLTTTPELPATELSKYCYSNIFADCTSLSTAPELPATTLTNYCYNNMFYNCVNLNRIKCLATNISATGCTSGWVNGVSSTGIFFKHPDMDNWSTGINGIPSGWTMSDMSYVTFTAELDGSSIGLEKLSTKQTLEYITDTDTTWNTFDTTTNITLNKGNNVYIRGMLSADNSFANYTQFKMSGKIAASGNCNAIWNYQDLNASLKKYCGQRMFYGCTSLTASPELPATTLASNCYTYMFYGCTSLTASPELPATTLAYSCYNYMFVNCSALVIAPELPATTLFGSCYYGMFWGCKSLTTAPELPATTLAGSCYNMMFYLCTSLIAAPELPATTLASNCYYRMFDGCTKLNYIKCLATDISATGCIEDWVNGVARTGTFVKHIDMHDWTTGSGGIPTGWDVKTAYTPQECVKLEITADNVSGRKTTTTIYYTATTNGIYDNGDIAEGKIITGTATSNEFEQNTSYTDTAERTITFEFMGVTATTTITQGVWIDASYEVVLNDQWRLSETQSNPDSELYDGVYESFSNTGVNNSTAIMYIDLIGYNEFDVYIRSHAESSYDYVTISEPNSTVEKASTKSKQNSGQDISSYTKVHYDNLTGEDRITITYRKDSSASNGNDQGYILIPKQ